ncbi:DNA helicase [Tanacetum coccineum]
MMNLGFHAAAYADELEEICLRRNWDGQILVQIGVNNNGSSASRRDRNLNVCPRLNSAVGMRSTSRRTGRRVLTSGSTVDSNSVASAVFITFTCNVNWLEIKIFMSEYEHLTASDRVDVVCRMFEQKIQALIAFLKEERIFGNVTGELMMHGPCGAASLKAPCKKGDKCSKKFPKKFNQKTFFDENGHTNGEFTTVATPLRHVIDEILNYVEGRFICAHEAYWRILKFDIHRREPVVQILAVHLEDMQRITFRDQDRLKSIIDLPRKKSTTLTDWFAFNEANEVGRHLSYLEFPSEFVWYSDRKSWSPRKTNKSSIGRLADFWEVQTVNGIFYPTYRAACQALGLLSDDKE